MGIVEDQQYHIFRSQDEGDDRNFLGIHIEHSGDNKFTLTQTGLISNVLKMT